MTTKFLWGDLGHRPHNFLAVQQLPPLTPCSWRPWLKQPQKFHTSNNFPETKSPAENVGQCQLKQLTTVQPAVNITTRKWTAGTDRLRRV